MVGAAMTMKLIQPSLSDVGARICTINGQARIAQVAIFAWGACGKRRTSWPRALPAPSLTRPKPHLRQEKGRKVLAVPAFIARMTMMFASSSSSADFGQTLACAMQPDARKASWLSRNSGPRPCVPRRAKASDQAFL